MAGGGRANGERMVWQRQVRGGRRGGSVKAGPVSSSSMSKRQYYKPRKYAR